MRNLLIFLLLIIAPPLKAEVNDNIAYTYYIANSDPSHSLLNILNSSSPIRHEGKIYHAYTTWNVKWSFRWFENPNGSCKITTVTTELSGSIKLQKLIGETASQREQFDEYLSALRIHELGHYNIGKDAATAIDSKILALPELPDCKDLEAAANDIGYRTLNEYKEKEIQYDTTTVYGRSQGAWLDK
jgi:predicted secreted Zn-dependent protease